MGFKNQHFTYAIPKGMVTMNQRAILFVLAEQTNDEKDEWAHNRSVLFPALGLDPDDESDKRYYRDQMKQLEDAGFISRHQERRGENGTFNRQSVTLNFLMDGIDWDRFTPTKSAASDGRKKHLAQFAHQFTDDDRQKASTRRIRTRHPVTETNQRSGNGAEPENTAGALPEVLPRHQDKTTTTTTTVADITKAKTITEDEDLEDRRETQKRALKEWAKQNSEEQPKTSS